MSDWIGITKAVNIVGVPLRTAYHWITGARLASRKRGGQRQVRLQDLRRLAAERGYSSRAGSEHDAALEHLRGEVAALKYALRLAAGKGRE